MKKALFENIKKIYKIFKNESFGKISRRLNWKINTYQRLTMIEIDEILKFANLKFSRINQIQMLKTRTIYMFAIKDNSDFNFGFFYLKNESVFIKMQDDKFFEIKKQELKNIGLQAVWEIHSIEENKDEFFIGINKLKFKYSLIFIFLELIVIGLVLIGNFYLKLMIDEVIPNQDNDLLIKSSIFFLLIFLITIIIEQVIFFIRKKIINENARKYYMKMLEYFNWLNHEDNQKVSFNQFQNYSNSITIMIQHYVFLIPDLITSIINILIITLILSLIDPLFILVEIALLMGIFIFNFFKLKVNSKLMTKQIKVKNNIEKWLNQFYFFSLEEKNQTLYQKYKLKIANNTELFETIDFTMALRFKKIEILESFFKKFIVVIVSVLFAWTIISNQSNTSVATLIYMMTLINTLIGASEEIFNIFIQIPQYRFYKPYFEKIVKYNKSFEPNKIKFDLKVDEMRFIRPNFLKGQKKYNLLLRNDTLIFGKSGIGKTTLVKSVLSNASGKGIYFNNVAKQNIKTQWLKENVIYYNAKFSEEVLSIENILHNNLENSSKIIHLVKKYQINLTNVARLSSGQKQFIKFISLLNMKNKIIILDEPLSNLDSHFKKEIIESFKSYLIENNFVIWISHDEKIQNLFKYRLEIK